MPYTVTGPDGKVHTFPDGTPAQAAIDALSKQYKGSFSALAPASGLPEGGSPTVASGAVMPSMQSTPPYVSDEDAMTLGLSMVLPTSGMRALQNTPGHAMRVEMAKKTADNLASLEEKQRAGMQILKGLDMVRKTVHGAPDDVLQNAIGPTASSPWFQGTRRTISGLVPGPVTPYDESYNLNNLLHHDIHGLVTQFMTAGKALNMSDERQKAFEATMADMLKATNRDDLNRVAEHADAIIRSSFGLPMKEIPEERRRTETPASADKIYVNPNTGEKIKWNGSAWEKVQ